MDVAPRFNDPTLHLRFPALAIPSATVAARGDTVLSDLNRSLNSNVSRTGEDLKANFFRIRALFSECHHLWSLSRQMDPDSFKNYLPIRPGGGPSTDGLKALALFKALRWGESEEDMEALNFTIKIAPECARIELGSKESPDIPSSTLIARPRKRKVEPGERFRSYEEGLLEVMKNVAESMTARSSAGNDSSTKRSILGEQRTNETERLVQLLSQKRELLESGLLEEGPEIMDELELESKCCKNRLRNFRKEKEKLK
jgi:hypothetical protein